MNGYQFPLSIATLRDILFGSVDLSETACFWNLKYYSELLGSSFIFTSAISKR